MRKRLAIFFLSLLVIALIAAIVLPRIANVGRYREAIAARASEAVGRDVTFGDLSFSWFPKLGVRVDDVAIAARPDEGGGSILEAGRVRIGARLAALFRGELEITSLLVEGPTATIVRDADGTWNVASWLPERDPDEPPRESGPEIGSIAIRDGRVTVVDHAVRAGQPATISFEDIDVDLPRLSAGRPIEFDAAFRPVVSGGEGVELRGSVGPWSDETKTLWTELNAPALPLGAFRAWFDPDSRLPIESGEGALRVRLEGDAASRLSLAGTVGLRDVQVGVKRPDGSVARSRFQGDIRIEAGYEPPSGRLDLKRAEIDLGDHVLPVEGFWSRTEGDLEMRLLPTRVPADELAALLATAIGDLPVALGSGEPVELEGLVRGNTVAKTPLAVEAGATVRGVQIRHDAMRVPLENVYARVDLRDRKLDVSGFRGKAGGTDIAGTVSVPDVSAPSIVFDLTSNRCDFGELLELVGGEVDAASSPPAGAATDAPPVEVRGSLRIRDGTFGTLAFDDMSADLRWRDGVVSLRPLATGLYGGRFEGRAGADLSAAVPRWTLAGSLSDIDVGAFLAANTDAGGALAGRFSGSLSIETAGAVEDAVIRSLTGGGDVRIEAGKIGRLDVLRTLSKVSGVFGENTVRRITGQLATEGTGFRELTAKLAFDSGVARLTSMRLSATDFECLGDSHVDLFTTELAGAYRLHLSPEISAEMRAEKSRAAELFWNPSSGRVEMPFGLRGPLAAPAASVDLGAAARSTAERKIRSEMDRWLERRLERLRGGDAGSGSGAGAGSGAGTGTAAPGSTPPDTAAPTTEPETTGDGGGGDEAPADPRGPAGPSGMRGTIASTRWSGPLIARDLTVGGTVAGPGLTAAALVVTDSRGTELYRVDRIEAVEAELARRAAAVAAAEGAESQEPEDTTEIEWQVAIDGKRLALGKFPLTVELVVNGEGGARVSIKRSVSRL